jgi:flagellar basal-body rod protein FlgC
MYGALDISTSGMIAERTRLTAISANVANRGSREADGTPYRARRVIFEVGDPTSKSDSGKSMGVHVKEIQIDNRAFNLRWDPGNPFAIKAGPQAGYVQESNVNSVEETVNSMQATRAYEANVAAAEATKGIILQTLRLLA